jgi:hypothetical protein
VHPPAHKRILEAGLVLAIALGAGACGEETPVDVVPVFEGTPSQVVTTDSGQLRVAVRYWPQPQVVGLNAVELAMTDSAGQPVDGLTIDVFPWMPAHGHGASVQPTITSDRAGVFVASPLQLFMPGAWELRLTIGGAVSDTGTASLHVQ